MEKDIKIFESYINEPSENKLVLKTQLYIILLMYCGLKYKFINTLTWSDVKDKRFIYYKNKIKIPEKAHLIINKIYSILDPDENELMLTYRSQMVNKQLNSVYGSPYSTGKLRKLFGYRILKLNNFSYKSLIYLTRLYRENNPINLIKYLGCEKYFNNTSIIVNDSIVDIFDYIETTNINKSKFIYLINALNTNLYKIGVTTNSVERITSIDSYLPYQIDVLLMVESENNRDIERKLHLKYKNKQVKREWFEFNDNDVIDIKEFINLEE